MKSSYNFKCITVVGLGYVGLPLALEFGKRFKTCGFDISHDKIKELVANNDSTGEVPPSEFKDSKKLTFTTNPNVIKKSDIVIICVPTPVDDAKTPDLNPIKNASELVGKNLKKNTTIIFESTVFPGATEEICVPILEKYSGLRWKKDFNVGYSPERINPGDKQRTLTKITKVVSGDNRLTLKKIANLYGTIISAGVFHAKSIKVAESAKVIENTQRDLNIALMNELAIICNRLKINSKDVLDAANTKWNFLPFKPGLVGGHCIGVDPYYLTYKAQEIGYHPEVILAGRKINDEMPKFISLEVIKYILSLKESSSKSFINVLGLTFKENCSDIRNSKVFDLIRELDSMGLAVTAHDPFLKSNHKYNYLKNYSWDSLKQSNCLILAVPHSCILDLGYDKLLSKLKKGGVLFDIKSSLDKKIVESKGYKYWSL